MTMKKRDPETNREDIWAYSDGTEDLRLPMVSLPLPDNI